MYRVNYKKNIFGYQIDDKYPILNILDKIVLF